MRRKRRRAGDNGVCIPWSTDTEYSTDGYYRDQGKGWVPKSRREGGTMENGVSQKHIYPKEQEGGRNHGEWILPGAAGNEQRPELEEALDLCMEKGEWRNQGKGSNISTIFAVARKEGTQQAARRGRMCREEGCISHRLVKP